MTRYFTGLRILVTLAILILLLIVVIWTYVLLPTVPHGVTWMGQDVSGMRLSSFHQLILTWENKWLERDIQLQSDGKTVAFTLTHLGAMIDVQPVLDDLIALRKGTLRQRTRHRWAMRHTALMPHITINESKLTAMIDQTWPEIQQANPVPAQRVITANDRVTYIEGKSIQRIHIATLNDQLRNLLLLHDIHHREAPLINLPFHTIHPEITVESLKAERIERKISQFTTTYRSSGTGRVHNIRSTAATVHDTLLAPGDVFDYEKIVRQTEKQFGFKQAPVIVNGKLVPGIGGGICQVSSTLYNAVLRSGLDIVERQNHSLPVRYVPLGQDATFASGYINFKFRNNLESHLLIRVETTEAQITVKLFGSMPEGLTYEVRSEIVSTIQPPVQYVRNPHLQQGSTKVISKGVTGYIVDTYRTAKQDGKVISSERVSRDHYRAKPTIIAANPRDIPKQSPHKSPKPRKPIIEDGVSGPIFLPIEETE